MITIQDMVQREVNVCLSSLISTLAQGLYGIGEHRSRNAGHQALKELAEQAFELACPVSDYEEAAIQAGLLSRYSPPYVPDDVRAMCEQKGIEPYNWEVYEHWSVSTWLAEKLIAHGEKVDTDFAGMCVWARTTTGQAIHADGVIERIYAELVK